MLTAIVIKSDLKYFLTQHNAKRIRHGEKPLTIRQIAKETGIATSTLTFLTTNRAKGIQFDTLSTLCLYFNCLPSDILRYTPDEDEHAPALRLPLATLAGGFVCDAPYQLVVHVEG
jgi:DNA-binding Xre family transcriptional regulator